MTPLPEQKKALAGAIVGFLGTAANVLLAGAPVENLTEAGIVLAQAGAGAAVTYLATFWIANRKPT